MKHLEPLGLKIDERLRQLNLDPDWVRLLATSILAIVLLLASNAIGFYEGTLPSIFSYACLLTGAAILVRNYFKTKQIHFEQLKGEIKDDLYQKFQPYLRLLAAFGSPRNARQWWQISEILSHAEFADRVHDIVSTWNASDVSKQMMEKKATDELKNLHHTSASIAAQHVSKRSWAYHRWGRMPQFDKLTYYTEIENGPLGALGSQTDLSGVVAQAFATWDFLEIRQVCAHTFAFDPSVAPGGNDLTPKDGLRDFFEKTGQTLEEILRTLVPTFVVMPYERYVDHASLWDRENIDVVFPLTESAFLSAERRLGEDYHFYLRSMNWISAPPAQFIWEGVDWCLNEAPSAGGDVVAERFVRRFYQEASDRGDKRDPWVYFFIERGNQRKVPKPVPLRNSFDRQGRIIPERWELLRKLFPKLPRELLAYLTYSQPEFYEEVREAEQADEDTRVFDDQGGMDRAFAGVHGFYFPDFEGFILSKEESVSLEYPCVFLPWCFLNVARAFEEGRLVYAQDNFEAPVIGISKFGGARVKLFEDLSFDHGPEFVFQSVFPMYAKQTQEQWDASGDRREEIVVRWASPTEEGPRLLYPSDIISIRWTHRRFSRTEWRPKCAGMVEAQRRRNTRSGTAEEGRDVRREQGLVLESAKQNGRSSGRARTKGEDTIVPFRQGKGAGGARGMTAAARYHEDEDG